MKAVSYLMNPGAEAHEWITVDLTCFAGEGPHKPVCDTWAVHRLGWCLDADGAWVWEPPPSSRDDEFLVRTRWPLDEALGRAAVTVKGSVVEVP